MKEIELIEPKWIQYRERVVGDTTASNGEINNEGIANRPSKTSYEQLDSLEDIVLGANMKKIFQVSYMDEIAQAVGEMEVNCAYIATLDGKLILNLPLYPDYGDRVRVSMGTEIPKSGATITIVGVQDNGFGKPIAEENAMFYGAGTLNFDIVLIFNGSCWVAYNQIGGVDLGLLAPKTPDELDDNSYIVVYDPDGNAFKLTLDVLTTYINDHTYWASIDHVGITQFATENEIITAKEPVEVEKETWSDDDDHFVSKTPFKAISPYHLRKELYRYITKDYIATNSHGDIPFADYLTATVAPFYNTRKLLQSDIYFVTDYTDLTNLFLNGTTFSESNEATLKTNFNNKKVISIKDLKRYEYSGRSGNEFKFNTVASKDTNQEKLGFASGANTFYVGTLYYNLTLKKLYFTQSLTSVLEIEPYLGLAELREVLNDVYVPLIRKVNNKPLVTDITIYPSDIPEFNSTVTGLVKNILNNTNNNPEYTFVGSTKWSNGILYSYNGSSWIQIFPARWGA